MSRTKRLFLAGITTAFAAGCQAILGIDDTTFVPEGADATDGTDGATTSDGGTDGSNGDGGTTDSGSPSFTLSSAIVRVTPGSTADVAIALNRAGLTGDVTFDVEGLDGGVTAAPVTIADGSSSGSIHVVVPSSTPAGTDVLTSVHASFGASRPLEIVAPGPSGTLDTSFANGEAAFTLGDAGTGATAVAVGVQKDGRVVLGARVTGSQQGWAVVRFDPQGVLDPTFDTNAAAAMPTSGILNDLALGPAGDVYALGTANDQMTIVHLNADGTRDNLFGTNGIASLNPVNFSQGTTGTGVAVQSDGRAVAVGADKRTSGSSVVLRFAKDGTVDGTFAQVTVSSETLARIHALPDDSLVAAGADSTSGGAQLLLLVPKNGGSSVAHLGTSPAHSAADVAAIGDAGYVTVGRNFSAQGICEITIFPFDAGASTSGVGLSQPVGNNAYCSAVVAEADGRYVFAGNGGGSFDHTGFVRRMIPPTTLDPTFADGGGVVFYADHSTPSSIPYRTFNALAIAPDGRIVAAGNQNNAGILVVRIWP
ncbi:MAG TPA: hypothetical protein VF407_06090 [Polyangiaceae bacterium]